MNYELHTQASLCGVDSDATNLPAHLTNIALFLSPHPASRDSRNDTKCASSKKECMPRKLSFHIVDVVTRPTTLYSSHIKYILYILVYIYSSIAND